MAQNSILLDKSLLFAARIIKLNKYLTKEKHEIVIAKQIRLPSAQMPMKPFTESANQILLQNCIYL